MPNPIYMRRKQLTDIDKSEHAGLLLDRGFSVWAKNPVTKNGIVVIDQHNNAAHNLHIDASKIEIPEVYKKAYGHWKQYHVENGGHSRIWFGELVNRLFLGMGEVSPLEAGITLHHTYGVPFIPGSAIKGVLSHFASELGLSDKVKAILFGKEASANNKQDSGEAGYIIFNDAWWIPESKALAPEVITVHAQKYYKDKGKGDYKHKDHPDFESPNPNPQIAIQGGFMFTVEGDEKWAEYAIKLLAIAMKDKGVGAKGASGYGYFKQNKKATSLLEEDEKVRRKQQEDILQQEKIEEKKLQLSLLAGEFYQQAQKNNWENDKNAFWGSGSESIEFWLDKLENSNDKQLSHQIEVLMNIHFKGVLEDPGKTTGKKNKPVFKPRVQAVAERLIVFGRK